MSVPTPQPIADWLEKLGLGQHAQSFAETEIDVSVLRHLTDQDLKDIGVPLGHRRKMLAAIGELGGPAATSALLLQNRSGRSGMIPHQKARQPRRPRQSRVLR
jgi:hypothetical protein